ncbi:MAG: hypothetical protein GEU74_07235 [Nitriliruptorales bacterium]|nr:hypothetical protein [Nitriliruptorales bacterium]
MRRIIMLTLLTGALALGSAAPAFAHRLTVDPPAAGVEAVVDQPVSTSWAFAHCNAAAPATATASSGGVVTFTPAQALTGCPVTPPPGG